MLIKLLPFDFVVIQLFSCVWLFENPWCTAHQASLSFSISKSLLKLMSIESMMPSNCLICYCSLLLLPSIFPSIKLFSNESALLIRCPKYQSFNFSISPSSENSGLLSFRMDLFISLHSKGLSRVFSNTTVESINSSVLRLLYGTTLTSVQNYWENDSFD